MNGLALKELAHSLATVMHDGQCRKGTGEPYVKHVERIADSLQGWQLKTVAYLHDLVEDTPVTFEMLKAMFPNHIVYAVDLLTRRDGEGYFEFIDRTVKAQNPPTPGFPPHLEGAALALAVKIADVRDNLRDIHDLPGDFASMEKRYTTALARLLEASGEDPE